MLVTSNGSKSSKPINPARMDFDSVAYNKWLTDLGLKEIFDIMVKKLL